MRSILGGLVLSLAAALVFVAGCAPLPPRAPMQTSSSYEDTFRAVARAAVATGYQVKSSDINAGSLSAERIWRQTRLKNDYLYLNVSVTKGQNGTAVFADINNPSGGFLSHNLDYTKFVDELKKQLPDIKVEQPATTK